MTKPKKKSRQVLDRPASVVDGDVVDAAELAIIRERLARLDAGEPTVSMAEVLAETLARSE